MMVTLQKSTTRWRRRSGKFGLRVAADTSGVAAIEYALIASLIALAILTGVGNLGDGVETHWNGIAENVAL